MKSAFFLSLVLSVVLPSLNSYGQTALNPTLHITLGRALSPQETILVQDLDRNNGQGAFYTFVMNRLQMGEEVLLVGETQTFDVGVFTEIRPVTATRYQVVYRHFRPRQRSQTEALNCLSAATDLSARLSCYEAHFELSRLDESYEASEMPWVMGARFGSTLASAAPKHMDEAIRHYSVDTTGRGQFLPSITLRHRAMQAALLARDLTSIVYWSPRLSPSAPEVLSSRKLMAAARLLDRKELMYVAYSYRCAYGDEAIPHHDVRGVKTATSFAGPLLLTNSEFTAYRALPSGACLDLLLGLQEEELYRFLEQDGYSYVDGEWVEES